MPSQALYTGAVPLRSIAFLVTWSAEERCSAPPVGASVRTVRHSEQPICPYAEDQSHVDRFFPKLDVTTYIQMHGQAAMQGEAQRMATPVEEPIGKSLTCILPEVSHLHQSLCSDYTQYEILIIEHRRRSSFVYCIDRAVLA